MAVSLDLLRTFLAVHREGSVTSAARRLSLSQPAVTGQIRALEAALGRQLFVRLPRGVAPTPVADLLARQVAGALDELEAVVAPQPDAATGTVHLGGAAEFLTELVLPALAPLSGTGLRLRVTLGLSDDLVRGLESGALDLAVLTARPRQRRLVAEPLYDEEFVLVAAPGCDPDPQRAPLVAYAEELPIVRRYWRSVFDTRATRTADVVVPNLHAVLAAVRAGAGFSVLPEYLCRADLAAGRLVALHTPEVPPLNTLFLAHRTGLANPAVAHVRARLLEAAKTF
ncbi:LysR family transcriptional regulator [Dactylosporangium sp. CA-139066]|uniref:LysR family transcriptional regulator n=1 Tax=Dactylosporangium sp. CA-139066 TaxID=3239930 RepID=UPI003D89CDD1